MLGGIALFGLVGCGSPDAAIVGDWADGSSSNIITFKDDHTAAGGTGAQKIEAKWSLSGKMVHFTLTSFGGKAIADVKKEAEKFASIANASPETKKTYDAGMKALDSGMDFTLSEDQKSMKGEFAGIPSTFSKIDKKS
jgi:hypothetical protein